MDGVGRVALRPLGHLDALLQAVAFRIKIVERPRNDGVVVLNDAEFYAEKNISPNVAADLRQCVTEEAITVFERAAVLVLAVVYG
jgi:hypothetical protein